MKTISRAGGLTPRVLTITLALLCITVPANAQLTPEQTRTLATIDTNLKQAEGTQLQLVEQMLPATGTLSGSQLRLAQTRLAAPKSIITQLQPMMASLPASDPKVAPVKARLDAAAKKIADLEARLSGSGTPPTPAAGGVRLDYRQEADLRDAEFFLGQVEGNVTAVETIVKRVDDSKDPLALDYTMINAAMNTIGSARQRGASVSDRIAKLPPNGQNVQATATTLKDLLARLDAAEAKLKPVHAKLSSTINPGSYPTLDGDLARLGELAQMYSDPTVLQSRYALAADLVKQSEAAAAEKNRIMTTYAALLQQQTDIGRRITGAASNFDAKHAEFTAAAQRQKAGLGQQLRDNLAEVKKMADQAVAEKKPAFFANGIPDQLENIENRLKLYAALDSAGAETITTQLASLRTELKSRADQLKESIIASNELPPNRYAGADRAQLEKLGTDAWKKIQPDAKVLMIRIPSQNWERDTVWRYENRAWYKIDRSKVQVQLLIQHDDKLAVIRPINVWKDHLSNDQINAIPMDDKESELIAQDFVPLAKVK